MSLSDFCDLVWLELWDDCPPLGDQQKYREAIHTIFVEGKEIGEIEVVDPKTGKVRKIRASQRAAEVDVHKPLPQHAVDALADLKAQIAKATGQPE